jgi:hypothetical protein
MDFAASEPSNFIPRHSSTRKRPSRKLLVVMIAAAAIALLGAGAFCLYYFLSSQRDPIPQSISKQVNFPLYYPDTLPKNWKLDKSSFYVDTNNNIVGYLLRGPIGNLNITIQPVPAAFDFNGFYTQRLHNTVQFLTPLGQGAIGKSNQQLLVGSLVTTSSWVLASPSSASVTQTDIQFILSHLQTTPH